MGKYKLVAKNEKGVAKSKEVNVEETSGKAPTLTKKLKSLVSQNTSLYSTSKNTSGRINKTCQVFKF